MELKNHPEVHMGLALYLAYKTVVVRVPPEKQLSLPRIGRGLAVLKMPQQ